MSLTEQLQEAEKVTGELIILHDLLTWSKRRKTHTCTHTYIDGHTCRHTYSQVHTLYAQTLKQEHGHVQTHMNEHAYTHSYLQTHIHIKIVREQNRQKQKTYRKGRDRQEDGE